MKSLHYSITLAVLFLSLVFAQVGTATAQTRKPEAVKITDGPRVENVTDTTATIAWTTNTGGSSIVRYGTDRNGLNQTAESRYSHNKATQAQNHRVHIKNLKPNTTYYFIVDSGQGLSTGTEAKSAVAQFRTKGAGQARGGQESGEKAEGPVKIIDGPRVEGVGDTWAVVAWTTNSASSSVIHYGTDRNHLDRTAESRYADVENASRQTHRVRLTNLKPKTTYYFSVYSGQGEGTGTQAASAAAQFTTK